MKEIKRDLFECISDDNVDAICITTNQNYTVNGLACMGGGCAYEAADRWPEIQKRLGNLLKRLRSNVPYIIGMVDKDANGLKLSADALTDKTYKCLIFSFPTINNLGTGANMQLIKQSATIMVDYANHYGLKGIVCPRMGAGIGGLPWSDVKSELEPILDDRFIIVSFDHEK
jgi:O-acetyl-ADP-ribose deacetylase (regulator of RNase III)